MPGKGLMPAQKKTMANILCIYRMALNTAYGSKQRMAGIMQ
jgi:hypothetical protein